MVWSFPAFPHGRRRLKNAAGSRRAGHRKIKKIKEKSRQDPILSLALARDFFYFVTIEIFEKIDFCG